MVGMNPVTLYGNKALRLHTDKDTITAKDGKIVVPPSLVEQVLKMGFSRFPPHVPAVEVAEEA